MKTTTPKKKASTHFLKKITQEANVISNIQNIVDKISKDGFLQKIKNTFLSVINNEIYYAVSELKKMDKRNSKKDLGLQLTNNTYIFKENLKKISGFVIDQIWKDKIKGDKINDTIKLALVKFRKGNFEEILEEEEEYDEELEDEEGSEGILSNESDGGSGSGSLSSDDDEVELVKKEVNLGKRRVYHKKKISDTSLELKQENYKKKKKM